MAVLKAKIEIAGVESACTTSSYSLQQGVDYAGRPNTTIQAKMIKLTFTGEEALNDKWIQLAFDSYRRESGYLTFLNGEERTFRRLAFYDAYLVHYELRFDARGHGGEPSLETEIHFSAAAVELDGARVENHSRLWWEKNQVTRFNALKKPILLLPSVALRATPSSPKSREERIEELAYDPDIKKVRRREGEIAYDLEKEHGPFERYERKSPSDIKGDFISTKDKKIYDVMGLPDNERTIYITANNPRVKDNFFKSIDKHFEEGEYVILDIEHIKKYEPELHNEIINHIEDKYGSDKLILYKPNL